MTVPAAPALTNGLHLPAHSLANVAQPFEPSNVIFQPESAAPVRPHVEHPRHERLAEELGGDDMSAAPDTAPDEDQADIPASHVTYTLTRRAAKLHSGSLGLIIDTRA
jgi:hypothetical protein